MNLNKIDKILLSIFGLTVIFIWISYFVHGFVEALFISFLIFIAVRTLAVHILHRYKKLKTITVWEMSQAFAIMGVEEQCKHLIKVLPDTYNPTIENNCIVFEKNNKKILVFPIFKTVPVSTEEILKTWRFAQCKNINVIWVLSKEYKRNIILLANSLEGEFIFFPVRKLHRFLLNHNALPKINFTLKKNKAKIGFSQVLSDIFVKRRAKYFLFSGLILAAMSFFVPLTIYYLVMSTILFGFSIACVVVDR